MIYLAQMEWLAAFGEFQFWQVLALLIAGVLVYVILRQRGDNRITDVVMGNNQALTQQFVKAVETTDKLKDQLAAQGETIRKQNEQTEATTDAIKAAAATLLAIQRNQESLTDGFQAILLHVEGTTEIMSGINAKVEGIQEDAQAIVVKVDKLDKSLEADTNATQDLITKRAETTIQAIRDTFESLSTTLIRFEKTLTESSKQHMCKELGEISTTLNEIRAQLNAQKEARNETPFTPTVDLPVMPDSGKSGNGTGDTPTHPND